MDWIQGGSYRTFLPSSLRHYAIALPVWKHQTLLVHIWCREKNTWNVEIRS